MSDSRSEQLDKLFEVVENADISQEAKSVGMAILVLTEIASDDAKRDAIARELGLPRVFLFPDEMDEYLATQKKDDSKKGEANDTGKA